VIKTLNHFVKILKKDLEKGMKTDLEFGEPISNVNYVQIININKSPLLSSPGCRGDTPDPPPPPPPPPLEDGGLVVPGDDDDPLPPPPPSELPFNEGDRCE
jgi:hypothetical protein